MTSFLSSKTTLDTLLGGRGLPEGSTILLRGAPGTGKTTLALQIARTAAQCGYSIVFVSVEDPPEIVLGQIAASLWPQLDPDDLLGRGAAWRLTDLSDYWERVEEEALSWLDAMKPSSLGFKLSPPESPPERLSQAEYSGIVDDFFRLSTQIDKLLNSLWKDIESNSSSPLLVVVDSLTALVDMAQARFRAHNERQMFLSVLRSFKGWHKQSEKPPTVIFTAEEGSRPHTTTAESYIADVVIQLRREKRTWPTPISAEASAEWEEDLLFCQVLKGRGLAIQRRACCFEFAVGEGIKFFPTYSAQGLVSLFFENAPQRHEIQVFRTVDVSASYPGLLVQEFTRSGLQRMFAVRRHAERIPRTHPLMLSNVDEYWVTELRKVQLLHPIPADRLRLFSQPDEDPAPRGGVAPPTGEAGESQGKNTPLGRIVPEFEKAKGKHYKDRDGCFLAVPHWLNVGMLVYRKDLLRSVGKNPPQTYEQLEAICELLRTKGLPYKYVLEFRTYDTLITTALELGWGHGAFWRTEPALAEDDPRIRDPRGYPQRIVFDKGGRFQDFVAAIERLHRWIHRLHIVPANSSVEPELHPDADWAFARHWYSTWVDVRTRRDKHGQLVAKLPTDDVFGIAKLPISRTHRKRDPAHRGEADGHDVEHHSAWGEWYLAIQSGSENVELGIELIDNLMTSRKISERARFGAGLPAAEKFYQIHGQDHCPETDKTFNQMREMFFEHAMSRADFDQFRRVARVLSGALNAVVTNSRPDPSVRSILGEAFKEIDPSKQWL